MKIQLLLVALFLLNLLLVWLTVILNKFKWYRLSGSFIFAFLPLLTVFFNQPRFELDHFWWRISGMVAVMIGFGLLIWAVREFKRAGLQVLDIVPQLIASGPYQFVRHPQYLGLIFIYVGWWWWWSAVYAFYFGMFILVLIWIQAYFEEKFILERQFGRQYQEYRREIGMFWIK